MKRFWFRLKYRLWWWRNKNKPRVPGIAMNTPMWGKMLSDGLANTIGDSPEVHFFETVRLWSTHLKEPGAEPIAVVTRGKPKGIEINGGVADLGKFKGKALKDGVFRWFRVYCTNKEYWLDGSVGAGLIRGDLIMLDLNARKGVTLWIDKCVLSFKGEGSDERTYCESDQERSVWRRREPESPEI